jgi:hypothetical protein
VNLSEILIFKLLASQFNLEILLNSSLDGQDGEYNDSFKRPVVRNICPKTTCDASLNPPLKIKLEAGLF